jgi:hypothetical protein
MSSLTYRDFVYHLTHTIFTLIQIQIIEQTFHLLCRLEERDRARGGSRHPSHLPVLSICYSI